MLEVRYEEERQFNKAKQAKIRYKVGRSLSDLRKQIRIRKALKNKRKNVKCWELPKISDSLNSFRVRNYLFFRTITCYTFFVFVRQRGRALSKLHNGHEYLDAHWFKV